MCVVVCVLNHNLVRDCAGMQHGFFATWSICGNVKAELLFSVFVVAVPNVTTAQKLK